jgi:hypothetical protein
MPSRAPSCTRKRTVAPIEGAGRSAADRFRRRGRDERSAARVVEIVGVEPPTVCNGRDDEEPAPDVLVPHDKHRWVAPLFAVVGLGLVPWTLYLAATLPSRHVQQNFYDVAWAGFDVALAALIVATGVGILLQRLWVQAVAAATAALLVCDAWFDVLSSNPGRDRTQAILLACFAELPMAGFCIYISRHSEQLAERAHRYALTARDVRRRRRGVERS